MHYMKLNTDKCHLLISRNKNEYMWAKLDQDIVWESNDNLRFDKHGSNICLKANRKLSALTRVAKFVFFKAFIKPQHRYCPLVWMFHGRQINDKINKLHERALREVKGYFKGSENLLIKDKSSMINHQNIQSLAIEIYKLYIICQEEILANFL